MSKGRITLERMKFHAYHGVYEEEKINGNDFTVTVSFDLDVVQAASSDRLAHTLDYARVYEVIAKEMNIRSELLEHVASRILRAIKKNFPQAWNIELSIRKLNPPMMGHVDAVNLTLRDS